MKKMIAFMLILALTLSLMGCGKEEPAPTVPGWPVVTFPNITVPKETTSAGHSDDGMEAQIEAEVETVLETLYIELEALSEAVDSYHAYAENADSVSEFYQRVLSASEALCLNMRLHSISIAQSILSSGKSVDDMYEDADILYDLIYDDMGDEIYDGIYDGILDDVYDAFYDGALDDQPEDVKYADWSAARSLEYEHWSDARSDTYDHWSDYREDVYDFWSDFRGALWDEDTEDAWEELEDFQKDVEKLAGKQDSAETPPPEEIPPETDSNSVAENGIRPEFKAAMDSYEAFFDEYVAFMKRYTASDNPLSMVSEYTEVMKQYTETMAALQAVDQSALSAEEALYYTEVVLRINQKLLEAV